MADNKNKLYVKRYKTLKEHRAAVAARKALKGGKNKGPVANSDAYGETLKKKKPAVKKPAVKKPEPSTPAKPKKTNKDQAKSNFFRSSSGTRGEYLPSNPNLKGSQKTTGRQKIAQEVQQASGNYRPKSRKPKNPKKGGTYKTITGITMVYNGKQWVQQTKDKSRRVG